MYFLTVHCATLAMSSENVVADEIADQEVDQEAKGSSDEFSIDGVVYAIETDHYPLDDDDDPGYNSENDAFYQLANSAGQSGQPSRQSLAPPSKTIFLPAPWHAPSRQPSCQSSCQSLAPPSQSVSRKSSFSELSSRPPSSLSAASPLPS